MLRSLTSRLAAARFAAIRSSGPRAASVGMLVTVLALSCFATSCGGGGVAAKDMILVQLQFLDRGLNPTAPTGTQNLPRNAIVGMIFSEQVNPGSINNQTIQLRYGPQFQSVPAGSFQVNGNQVLFDPTVTAQGQPNPPGFDPVEQYVLDIPGIEEQNAVVENLDNDPNLTTFFTQFTTSGGWLRELRPPEVVEVVWAPNPDELTGNIPGNGLMGLTFDEAMDPSSFIQGRSDDGGNIDIRYNDAAINVTVGVDGAEIDGTFSPSADWRTFWFKPTFSFGAQKLVFTTELFQGLTDLSGNLLVNPGSFGPFTCDGKGISTGVTIIERFTDQIAMDPISTDADWGSSEEGVLVGLPVTSRNAYIYGYVEADNGGDSGRGQYAPIVAPLIGKDLNNFVTNVNPPTADGRRVMWSFPATKIGQKGSITSAAWGPDSNATFAAFYKTVKLRAGYQKQDQLTLAPSFSGNYEGSPASIYSGSYSVQQSANVGNTPGEPAIAYGGTPQMNPGCQGSPSSAGTAGWNAPLFDFTGWYKWPKLTNFFEWDPQGAPDASSRVLIFDASVEEGDSFQQVRGWFGVTYPCSGVLIGGLPLTRLYAEYEGESPNPESNFVAGIQNPEQSLTDTCFTITRRVSVGQSIFYGPDNIDDGTPGGADNTSTLGSDSDYLKQQISPSVQAEGAQVQMEFMGASGVDVGALGEQIVNQAAGPFTKDSEGNPAWVQDINRCDGMGYIRYRASLISNLTSLEVARIGKVVIPMIDANP
jgi:hypothetical protein